MIIPNLRWILNEADGRKLPHDADRYLQGTGVFTVMPIEKKRTLYTSCFHCGNNDDTAEHTIF